MAVELSIVIPSHNRPDLLRICLERVRVHGPFAIQVIVVDDGSPQALISAAARDFSGVEVVRLAKRQGFCVAANAGIGAARGTIVELLNDDTEVTANWASAAMAHFQDPTIAAVAPLVLRWPDGQVVDSAGDRYYLGGVAGKRGHGQPLGAELCQPCEVFGASASSAFYRRSALLQVGGFPESFGAYFEDVDLSFRLHRAGYRVWFEPTSRVLHRVSATHGQPSRQLLEQMSRNEERVFWRNLPGRELLGALPSHVAVLLGKAWRRWRDGNLLPFLGGRIRALAELPSLLCQRRCQRQRDSNPNLSTWKVENRFWTSPV